MTKKLPRNILFYFALACHWSLTSCVPPKYETPSKTPAPASAGQDTNPQKPDADSTDENSNKDGKKPIVTPDVKPIETKTKFKQDFDLVSFDGKDVKLSEVVTTRKFLIDFVEKDCNSCVASARKLFELTTQNKFNKQVCTVMILLLANTQDPSLKAAWKDALGPGSESVLYQLKNPSDTVVTLITSFGSKAAAIAPFALVGGPDANFDAKILIDSEKSSVTPDFFGQAETTCN